LPKERSTKVKEVVLRVFLERNCKNSVRVQATGEAKEFHPDRPSQFYIKNEIFQALGSPQEFTITMKP